MDGAASQPVVISRIEARAQGLTRYYTGIPCKRGHLSVRDMNGECRECRVATARAAGVPSLAEKFAERRAKSIASGQVRAALMVERREASAKLQALRAQQKAEQRAARSEAQRQATAMKMQERARKREERYIAKCEHDEAKRKALILRLAEKGLPKKRTYEPRAPKIRSSPPVPMVVLLRGLKVTTHPPEVQRTVREGMVNCLGRRANSVPHKFHSEDVRRIRICPSCKNSASREYLVWTE